LFKDFCFWNIIDLMILILSELSGFHLFLIKTQKVLCDILKIGIWQLFFYNFALIFENCKLMP